MLSSFLHLPSLSGVSFIWILICNFLLKENGGLGTGLFSVEPSNRTRGNSLNYVRGGPGLSRFRKRHSQESGGALEQAP